MEGKIVFESFTPNSDREGFYYKPSKQWNYLVWCDSQYKEYLMRVYGTIPQRINPIQLHLLNNNGEVVMNDFKVNLPDGILMKILENGGECEIKQKGSSFYMKGKRLKPIL